MTVSGGGGGQPGWVNSHSPAPCQRMLAPWRISWHRNCSNAPDQDDSWDHCPSMRRRSNRVVTARLIPQRRPVEPMRVTPRVVTALRKTLNECIPSPSYCTSVIRALERQPYLKPAIMPRHVEHLYIFFGTSAMRESKHSKKLMRSFRGGMARTKHCYYCYGFSALSIK